MEQTKHITYCSNCNLELRGPLLQECPICKTPLAPARESTATFNDLVEEAKTDFSKNGNGSGDADQAAPREASAAAPASSLTIDIVDDDFTVPEELLHFHPDDTEENTIFSDDTMQITELSGLDTEQDDIEMPVPEFDIPDLITDESTVQHPEPEPPPPETPAASEEAASQENTRLVEESTRPVSQPAPTSTSVTWDNAGNIIQNNKPFSVPRPPQEKPRGRLTGIIVTMCVLLLAGGIGFLYVGKTKKAAEPPQEATVYRQPVQVATETPAQKPVPQPAPRPVVPEKKIQPLPPKPAKPVTTVPPRPATTAPARFTILTNSYHQEENALRELKRLKRLGFDAYITVQEPQSRNSRIFHGIKIGPYTTLAEAKKVKEELTKKTGSNVAIIIKE